MTTINRLPACSCVGGAELKLCFLVCIYIFLIFCKGGAINDKIPTCNIQNAWGGHEVFKHSLTTQKNCWTTYLIVHTTKKHPSYIIDFLKCKIYEKSVSLGLTFCEGLPKNVKKKHFFSLGFQSKMFYFFQKYPLFLHLCVNFFIKISEIVSPCCTIQILQYTYIFILTLKQKVFQNSFPTKKIKAEHLTKQPV